jgi:outer membrane protein OmpA-like peptidoglycan-associated protein
MNKVIKYQVYFQILLIVCISKGGFSANQLDDSIRVEKEYVVNKVYGLNSKYTEFSPVWYNTELVFASDREWDYNTLGEANWDHIKNINLFKVEVKSYQSDSVVFNHPKIFNRLLISDAHVGPIAFNSDGSEAIFSEVVKKASKRAKTYKPQLFSIQILDGRIFKKEKLGFSDLQYSYSQPTYSADGQSIYFVSNMPCNYEGINIFMSKRNTEGWSEPVVVEALNSNGDDMFPTIKGNKMYFSSTGFDSYGGLDLFVSEFVNGSWITPINLGPSINTAMDEFSMVFNPDGKSGYFTSNRENGIGDDDIYSFNLIEKAIVQTNYYDIKGQFEYTRLEGHPENMEVMLLDEDGEIVAVTKTDKDGNFVFDYLPEGKKYTLKVNEEGEVVLSLFKGDGNALLTSDENGEFGEFVFRKLSFEGASVLSLMDEGDIDLNTGLYELNGQLQYQRLEGYPDGMKVYLIDEDGNIVKETKTDEYGNFKFELLSSDKNLLIKIDEGAEDMNLIIFNNVDHVMATLTNDANGEFSYRLLDANYDSNISLLTEDEINLKFKKERMMLAGNFVFESLDGIDEELQFEILDNKGDLLMNCNADSTFYFRYDDLPLLEELIIKLDESSPYFKSDVKLEIVNRLNDVMIILEKDEFGMFVYKRMVASKYHTTKVEDLDTTEIVVNETKIHIENFIIYYPKNGSDINELYYSALDSMIVSLKENNKALIQVHGHASSTASEDYNMKLSIKRKDRVVNYLIKNGIDKTRISSNAYGESQLLNMCEDDEDCEEEMHKQNRRSELKILIKD